MIHAVLVFNNDGAPRLVKFYTPIGVAHQQALLEQVHTLVSQRTQGQCSFLTVPPLLQYHYNAKRGDVRVVYRHYATLYFVAIVDETESELGMLDLIQVFVQVLNRCFTDVCELDLVFHWQVLNIALGEMIQGGMVVETSIGKIFKAIDGYGVNSAQGPLGASAARTAQGARGLFSNWPLTR